MGGLWRGGPLALGPGVWPDARVFVVHHHTTTCPAQPPTPHSALTEAPLLTKHFCRHSLVHQMQE